MGYEDWTIPRLETDRLLLRQLEPADIDDIFALFSDPDVMKFDGGLTMTDRRQAERFVFIAGSPVWYHLQQSLTWAFIDKESGKFIGTGGFKNWHGGPEAEVGLDIRRDCWQKGYGREALQKMISFAFQSLNLQRVYALMLPKNKAAQHLFARTGFKYRGMIDNYSHAYQTFQVRFYVKENFS